MQARRKKSKKKSVNGRPRPSPRVRERLAIIGAGRLGTALGRALGGAGYKIEVVVARHSAHARNAARLMGANVLSLTSTQVDRLNPGQLKRFESSKVILITTPDDAIDAVIAQLAAVFKARRESSKNIPRAARVALHVSGALSSEVLEGLREVGFAVGSLHPLVSVSDSLSGSRLFDGAYFSIDGDAAAKRVARGMVRVLGGKSFTLGAGTKALYHAAAVTASGHVVALFDIALEMLGRCGLTQPNAQKILLPLLESTVTNLASKSPPRALTGTFARADLSTARQHLAAIKSEKLTDALSAYRLLGKRSIQLARAAGVSRADLEAIEALMQETAGDS